MPSDLNLTAWVLLWIAALSSLGTFILTFRRDRQARRKARLEEERVWSLQWADYLDDAPYACLRLRLHDVELHKCRLKSVTITKPGGARILPLTWVQKSADEPWQKRAKADTTGLGRRIELQRDLDGSTARFAGQQYDDAFFYVLIPTKPRFSFSNHTSVSVVCRVAEISRKSRRRKITLTSPPVDWAKPAIVKPQDLQPKM